METYRQTIPGRVYASDYYCEYLANRSGQHHISRSSLSLLTIKNTKDATNSEPCWSAYMALPAPHGLYIACNTCAQLQTSTASVTCPRQNNDQNGARLPIVQL